MVAGKVPQPHCHYEMQHHRHLCCIHAIYTEKLAFRWELLFKQWYVDVKVVKKYRSLDGQGPGYLVLSIVMGGKLIFFSSILLVVDNIPLNSPLLVHYNKATLCFPASCCSCLFKGPTQTSPPPLPLCLGPPSINFLSLLNLCLVFQIHCTPLLSIS